jgi:hypothetical protein
MSIESEDFELTAATTAIRGFWLDLGSSVVKDSGWVRIEWLLENRLECLVEKNTETGSLYRDPADNRLWHFYRVSPGLRDGGPPALQSISQDEARDLFGDVPA